MPIWKTISGIQVVIGIVAVVRVAATTTVEAAIVNRRA
jgi:hypothetical protein